MSYALDLLRQLASGLARQLGLDCEIVVHDLKKHDLEYSIVYTNNGYAMDHQEGDGSSRIVLGTPHKDPTPLEGHPGYLTRISNGKILKSDTIYIRNEEGDSVDYLLSINYDMTGLMTMDRSIKVLIGTEPQGDVKQQPEQTVHNVNDLLDTLTEQSMALIDKPTALMNKEEEVTVTQFLNDVGAPLITESRSKVSKYFGTSKFTLYNYTDISSRKSDDRKT